MKRTLWAAGAVAMALAVGAVAGTALADRNAQPNGVAASGATNHVAPNFSTTTNVAVKAAAVFASDGTKVRASTKPFGLASSSRISTGVYDVRFLHNITGCAWFGTIGFGQTPFGGSTGPAMISMTGRAGTNNGLFIQTFNGSGAPTDEPFMVEVVC